MAKNRAKVSAVGGDVGTTFALGTPVLGFTALPEGNVTYVVLTSNGEWQVGYGTVTGTTLARGTVEENHLGTTDQINFTGETIQIAEVYSAGEMTGIISKLAGIEDNATADQSAVEVPFTPVGGILDEDLQGAVENLDTRVTLLSQTDDGVAAEIAKAVKHIGITPPTDPIDGQEWLNTETMKEYTWYVGLTANQWIRNP